MNNFFKKFSIKPKDIKNFTHANPHKHWMIILGVFFVLMLGLILFTFYLLYEIKNDQIFQVSETRIEEPSPIKEKLLNDVTTLFSQKAQKTEEIKLNPVVYEDPSL